MNILNHNDSFLIIDPCSGSGQPVTMKSFADLLVPLLAVSAGEGQVEAIVVVDLSVHLEQGRFSAVGWALNGYCVLD